MKPSSSPNCSYRSAFLPTGLAFGLWSYSAGPTQPPERGSSFSTVGGRIEVRLDSPTGQLLGQTDMPLPVDVKNPADVFKPIITNITSTPAMGRHDRYFVFKKAPLFVPVTAQLFN